ncbi:gamma-glutamyl-gamma-aminobutyrate hydrolase family protein [Streptococcus pluranimalium]|uniref:Gamma-glutamyl hydrolase n=1 Tax=Streptococcus pluranimalium TaxID=82348 RepID=A0A2L0D4U5_9STRE|nr:gamma-glutamyl-gamma-aminobutyrate hydrolase family protein [Streptococcus pluranimalium]AUW96601.1 gamma-glutamyl hydrolase [Streptococcus pluranimalium]
MTKQPIIGIAGNRRVNPENGLLRDYVPHGFVEGVKRAGGLPLILPISDTDTARQYISMVDKLILPGGQNVNPALYGQENQAKNNDDFFEERDLFEIALLAEALKQQKPIFTVCRGTQLMNVALGGSLHQDIENHWQDDPADYLTQEMLVKEGTPLRAIYGERNTINSFHHQSIDHLASELEVIAQDPKDGTIEAVQYKHQKVPYLGVQWHPELLINSRPIDQSLFDFVVNEL